MIVRKYILQSFTTVRLKLWVVIEYVGSCTILKSANNLNINVGGPTMYYYSIFQQLFKFIPRYRFEKSVEKHSGDRYCKHFTAIRQLKTILYAQLAGKDSLREVESGLLMNAGQHQHRPALPKKGVISDERIEYIGATSVKKYPGKLRLIEFIDDEGKTYQFLTNNFKLAASSIAEIYRQRWQIELFFKWIKQNLKIKSFLGTSKNAVMTQIWVALILYLLLSCINFTGKCRYGITELVNRLCDTLMSDFALVEVLNLTRDTLKKPPDWNAPEQLDLFANSCNLF